MNLTLTRAALILAMSFAFVSCSDDSGKKKSKKDSSSSDKAQDRSYGDNGAYPGQPQGQQTSQTSPYGNQGVNQQTNQNYNPNGTNSGINNLNSSSGDLNALLGGMGPTIDALIASLGGGSTGSDTLGSLLSSGSLDQIIAMLGGTSGVNSTLGSTGMNDLTALFNAVSQLQNTGTSTSLYQDPSALVDQLRSYAD